MPTFTWRLGECSIHSNALHQAPHENALTGTVGSRSLTLKIKMDRTLMKSCKLIITRVVIAIAALVMTTHAVSSANPKSVRGVVQTGGTTSSQPLPNVHVTLFEATPALPVVGQATTDASGQFTIPYRKSSSSSIFFLKADISEGVEFVTILGSNLPTVDD